MSTIWPVSDCDVPVELIVIPDYHRNQPCGYIAVQTAAYSARWENHRPSTVCVRPADGSGGADWLEWSLDGELHDAGGASLLGAATGEWSPDELLKGSRSLRGENVTLEWTQPHERGELRARLVFARDSIRCNLTFSAALGTRYRCAVIGKGTRVWADHAFDYNPDTSGTFQRPLHALRPTGAKWLTPSPFALSFAQPDGAWSIAAIECPREQLTFCGFGGRGGADGTLGFELDYASQPDLAGSFSTPELVWRFGFTNEFTALQAHVDGLVAAGLATPIQRTFPAWHRRPMACGWHRQVELASQLKDPGVKPEHLAQLGFATGAARAQDFSRQDVYEDHLSALERAGIDVGTVVIDHGWSLTEGDWRPDPAKWPDLRGFVSAQHSKGRRVLLWICVMNTGLPENELVRNLEGLWPLCLDPRHPKWLARLSARLGEMLGAHGIGADGLKFDFTGPQGNPSRWGGQADILHGYTYLAEFYRAVMTAAIAVRADALLDFQCAHPQFAEFHTMTRLNDYFLPQSQALRVMATRAEIARIASFGALVDTDCPAGLAYLRGSSAFGNQSLYLTHAQLEDSAVVAAVLAGQSPAIY